MSTELLPHCDYPRRAKIERLVSHLHGLGPRPLAEFLDALAIENGIGAAIIAKLAEYGRLSPSIVAAVGGDMFPLVPLREIGGGPP